MDENKIKTIVVCGDSFCSAETGSARHHFSEVLADQYQYQVTNLAQGGMSTVGICFQIREAILLKPDAIVYNTTDPGRVDLEMNSGFSMHKGLKNFVYAYPSNSSYGSKHVGTAKSPIFSTVHQGLDEQTLVPITSEQIKAIDYYLKYMFNWHLKEETDRWMYSYWANEIAKAGIVGISLAEDTELGKPMYDFAEQNPSYNSNYHTDPATQQVIADSIHNELKR